MTAKMYPEYSFTFENRSQNIPKVNSDGGHRFAVTSVFILNFGLSTSG